MKAQTIYKLHGILIFRGCIGDCDRSIYSGFLYKLYSEINTLQKTNIDEVNIIEFVNCYWSRIMFNILFNMQKSNWSVWVEIIGADVCSCLWVHTSSLPSTPPYSPSFSPCFFRMHSQSTQRVDAYASFFGCVELNNSLLFCCHCSTSLCHSFVMMVTQFQIACPRDNKS